ncbi:unnamed protein product, partial [Gulo gulo]
GKNRDLGTGCLSSSGQTRSLDSLPGTGSSRNFRSQPAPLFRGPREPPASGGVSPSSLPLHSLGRGTVPIRETNTHTREDREEE